MSAVFENVPDYEATTAAEADGVADPAPPAPPKRRGRVLRRVLVGLGVAVLVLALAGVLLYEFGSMWVPRPEVREAYAAGVAAGQVPPIESQFHIPIPGCVCHSPDPVLQMQHESRRIRDCRSSGCHGG